MVFEKISKNSPADVANFKRGDIVNGFNGIPMTINNYSSVLDSYSNDDSVEFNFVENDGITHLKDETISKSIVADNPVHFTKVFNDINGSSVGYLVYNSFSTSFNDELNSAFLELDNVDELILDLRLNGGGSVETSAYLASMIYGNASTNDIFAKLTFNSKKSEFDNSYTFEDILNVYDTDNNSIGTENINRLSNLNRVYILTSNSTASASEMIINGLRPYMDVIIIGETTFGKNSGSITLYDAPSTQFTDRNLANTSHSYAMQPIVFQITNKNNQSDYALGFEPDISINESSHWNAILPFGDEDEVILKAALDNIKGFSAKTIPTTTNISEKIDYNLSSNKFEKEMYIDSSFFK